MKKTHGFLKFDGLTGISSEENHKGWVNIKSLAFNMNQHSQEQNYSKLSTLKPQTFVSNMTITRNMDSSSALIMATVGKGEMSEECIIEFVQGGSKSNSILYYKLNHVRIVNYSVNITEQGEHQETIVLSYSIIRFKYTPFINENEKESPYIYEHKL